MEQAVVKILLLGICGYGSNYIKEISERDIPGIKIEGICEVVPNAADLYPIIKEQNIPIYQTPEDFYKEHTADLAVVSTPIHLHYSQIVTCLTHGSNVLTEKPVCTSVEGAHKLEQLEDASVCAALYLHSCYLRYRYHADELHRCHYRGAAQLFRHQRAGAAK